MFGCRKFGAKVVIIFDCTPHGATSALDASRAGRRACTTARATACIALVERYDLCYAFPKIRNCLGTPMYEKCRTGRGNNVLARSKDSEGGKPPNPRAHQQEKCKKMRARLHMSKKSSNFAAAKYVEQI